MVSFFLSFFLFYITQLICFRICIHKKKCEHFYGKFRGFLYFTLLSIYFYLNLIFLNMFSIIPVDFIISARVGLLHQAKTKSHQTLFTVEMKYIFFYNFFINYYSVFFVVFFFVSFLDWCFCTCVVIIGKLSTRRKRTRTFCYSEGC